MKSVLERGSIESAIAIAEQSVNAFPKDIDLLYEAARVFVECSRADAVSDMKPAHMLDRADALLKLSTAIIIESHQSADRRDLCVNICALRSEIGKERSGIMRALQEPKKRRGTPGS